MNDSPRTSVSRHSKNVSEWGTCRKNFSEWKSGDISNELSKFTVADIGTMVLMNQSSCHADVTQNML